MQSLSTHWLQRCLIVGLLVSGWCGAAAAESPAKTDNQSLKEYVAKDDGAFSWEVRDEGSFGQTQYARLHLVSQEWKDTTWRHVLWVLKPNNMPEGDVSAIMLIAGGSWKPEWGETGPAQITPPREATLLATLAQNLKSPMAILQQVPNQPLLGDKYEDEIIAETFSRFMKNEGDDWPLLMPMVKSAAKAMDAVQAYGKEQWQCNINKFTLTGASKRGWTTWLTSAVDSRVDALAPMVIDMLNMSQQMKHQVATWGDYSEQIRDYTELNLPKFIETPRGVVLQSIVDPYRYREALQQPKLLIFGTNDRYWPLDACNLYWEDLQGSKYLLYVPNNGHGINDFTRVVGSLSALHKSRIQGAALPKLEWKYDASNDGKVVLKVTSDKAPDQMRLWQASSPSKDFRDAKWTSALVKPAADQAFEIPVAAPSEGYSACFAEAQYNYQPMPAYFSTNIRILKASTAGGQ